jgi:hypothetical protein
LQNEGGISTAEPAALKPYTMSGNKVKMGITENLIHSGCIMLYNSIYLYPKTGIISSVRWLLVTGNVVPSSSILANLMMEALHSFETLVLTKVTWRNIPEDGISHSHHCENLKSYMDKSVLSVSGVHLTSYPMNIRDLSLGTE